MGASLRQAGAVPKESDVFESVVEKADQALGPWGDPHFLIVDPGSPNFLMVFECVLHVFRVTSVDSHIKGTLRQTV